MKIVEELIEIWSNEVCDTSPYFIQKQLKKTLFHVHMPYIKLVDIT